MRKWIAIIAVAALLACALVPGVSFTEDRNTVLLARAIYALARDASYDAKLAIGTVAMNRRDSVWFDDTLDGVLNEQHQFPIGSGVFCTERSLPQLRQPRAAFKCSSTIVVEILVFMLLLPTIIKSHQELRLFPRNCRYYPLFSAIHVHKYKK